MPYAYGLRPGAVISDTIGNDALLHINWSPTGRGLRAYGMAQSGVKYGIVGASRSPSGFGGYFYNSGNGVGLWAQSANGNAIKAEGENAVSVLATNTNSPAVWGVSTDDAGIHGASGSCPRRGGLQHLGPGVYGESVSGAAIAANGGSRARNPPTSGSAVMTLSATRRTTPRSST